VSQPRDEPELPIAVAADPLRSYAIDILFTCMLRFRTVREEGLLVLKEAYFSKLGEGHFAYLLGLLRRLHPEHPAIGRIPYTELVNRALDETIPQVAGQPGILAKDEVDRLLGMPSIYHPDEPHKSVWGLLYRSYHQTSDDDVTREQGFKLIADVVKERGFYEPMRDALTRPAVGMITNIDEIYARGRVIVERVEAIAEDPFGGLLPRGGQYDPVRLYSTGVTWLDGMMGGGQAAPEIHGLLAGTGIWKSTFCMQMALGTSRVMRNDHQRHGVPLKHVVVVSYEDDDQRLLARTLCCSARIDKDKCMAMDGTGNNLSRRGQLKPYELKYFAGEPGFDPGTFPGEAERLAEAQAKYASNFHTIYMCNKCIWYGYVDEIAAILSRARDRHGWEYAAIYVDSIDWLVGNHMAAQGLAARDHKRATIMEAVPLLRSKLGERFGASVWVTNQLAGAHLKRGSTTEFSHSDAGDSKDWGRALDTHLAFGTLDRDDNTVLHISKARRSGTRGMTHVVGLRGAMGQFVSLAKDYVIENGTIIRRDIDEIVVPVPGPSARTRRKTAGNDLGDVPFEVG
jgi:hypothetical protein